MSNQSVSIVDLDIDRVPESPFFDLSDDQQQPANSPSREMEPTLNVSLRRKERKIADSHEFMFELQNLCVFFSADNFGRIETLHTFSVSEGQDHQICCSLRLKITDAGLLPSFYFTCSKVFQKPLSFKFIVIAKIGNSYFGNKDEERISLQRSGQEFGLSKFLTRRNIDDNSAVVEINYKLKACVKLPSSQILNVYSFCPPPATGLGVTTSTVGEFTDVAMKGGLENSEAPVVYAHSSVLKQKCPSLWNFISNANNDLQTPNAAPKILDVSNRALITFLHLIYEDKIYEDWKATPVHFLKLLHAFGKHDLFVFFQDDVFELGDLYNCADLFKIAKKCGMDVAAEKLFFRWSVEKPDFWRAFD